MTITGRENSLARTRILIADDHKQMREQVVRELESEFDVVGAVADGEALLAAAPKTQPDVCVLDISMPIMSGIEAAAQLQASNSVSRIVFLTVTQPGQSSVRTFDYRRIGERSDLLEHSHFAISGR